MFELIVRVVLASGAMAASGILGQPSFELTWKTALFFAAYSYLLYMVGQRGLKNPGIAGLAAVVDCGILAIFLADLGQLSTFGAVCAVPMVVAFFRDRANAAMMSPLVASWLLVGANLFGGGNAFTPFLLVQALAVLVVGIGLSQLRTMRENKREKTEAEPIASVVTEERIEEIPDLVQIDAQGYDDFRESFRALTDSARELEKRGRKDKACVQLFESVARQQSSPFAAIAATVQDLTGAEAVIVHTLTPGSENARVRGLVGNLDPSMTEASINLSKGATENEVIQRARLAVHDARDPNAKSVFNCLTLKLRGKLIGLRAAGALVRGHWHPGQGHGRHPPQRPGPAHEPGAVLASAAD